jgi:ribosome-associated protein
VIRPEEMTPEEIASAVAEYASDRKALEIVQLDLRGIISYTDYFVICTAASGRRRRFTTESTSA